MYIYIGAENGRTAEMFKDIIVRPDDGANNVNLSKVEYFFDNDPGFGLATAANLSGTSYGLDTKIDIDLAPHNLNQGVHLLGVRVRDSENQWSLTHSRPFLVLGVGAGISESVTQVQYFYDSLKTDQTNLVTVSANPGAGDQIALPLAMNLPQGVHTIGVRVKDNTGRYSLFHTRPFLVLGVGTGTSQAISKVEYFLDADPGYGNGTQVAYSANGDGATQIMIDLNAVPAGVHTVFVRVQDNGGRWSLTHVRPFVIMPNLGGGTSSITRIEYFLNQPDPGQGNANSVSFSPTGGSDVTAVFDAPLTGLPGGTHRLYARAKDSGGRWSTLHSVAFDITVCAANAAYFTIKSGTWDDPAVWNCGSLPTVLNDVRISPTHTITLPVSYTAKVRSLEMQGQMQYGLNAGVQMGQEVGRP